MADHYRALDAQLPICLVEQLGLLIGGPHAPPRALTVAEARPIEDHHPTVLQQELGHAAGVVVIPGHGVAMNQDHGLARAPVAEVESDAVHLDELPLGRVPALGQARDGVVRESEGA